MTKYSTISFDYLREIHTQFLELICVITANLPVWNLPKLGTTCTLPVCPNIPENYPIVEYIVAINYEIKKVLLICFA